MAYYNGHLQVAGLVVEPMRRWVWIALVILFTLVLRTAWLHDIPPHLYFDEAGQGLDARGLLHGIFRAYFPRAMGREPLFTYLLVPSVAVADTSPVAIRVVSALLGALTAAALVVAARSLWPQQPAVGWKIGLIAAGLWASNYWPQSVNRLGFRVNTLPLLLTLAIAAWAAWSYRPTRKRASLFGFLAGLTLLTYLSARITPVLWISLWFLSTNARQRRALIPDFPFVVFGFLAGAGLLLGHFGMHPEDAVSRVLTFPVWEKADNVLDLLRIFGLSALAVLGGFFGWAGDPIARHNLPGRPPFFPVVGALFAVGLLLSLYEAVRGAGTAKWRARTLLLWWAVMLVPSTIAAIDNPHFLRLFGALPPALLIAARLLAEAWERLPATKRALGPALVGVLLATEVARTAHAYFITWARHTDLYRWFQEDVWTIGEQVRRTPNAVGLVPLNPFYGEGYREYVLDYVFPDVPIFQLRVIEDQIEQWLQTHLGRGNWKQVLLVTWFSGDHVNADPKDILGFYLTREGIRGPEQKFRTFRLRAFQLSSSPQFTAEGNRVTVNASFASGVRLLESRWGVAYPNPERNAHVAAAGTPVWAILTWQLETPLPDLKVTLDVVDAQGHRLGSDEQWLLDADRWPTSRWKPGAIGRSYHLVTIPATTLPGTLSLESRVYEGGSLRLLFPNKGTSRASVVWATVTVQSAFAYPSPKTLPIRHRVNATVAPGIVLLGLATWPETLAPGQLASLRFYWQVRDALPSETVLKIQLEDGTELGQVILPGGLPQGAIVHTDVDLRVPPHMPNGVYSVEIRFGTQSVALGPVEVKGRPRLFTAPPVQYPATAHFGTGIRLLGVTNVEHRGRTITFTLVWQVTQPNPRPLKRFVHVLGPDHRPLAQEDTVPCRGECPAHSWLAGEVLLDEVWLQLPEGLDNGSFPVGVGWYDSTSLERLPAYDAAGQPLPDNVFLLPISVP